MTLTLLTQFIFPWPPLLADGGILYAFAQSNMAGKIIVALLLLASVFSWTLMASKVRHMWQARRQTTRFLRSYRADRHSLRQYRLRREFQGSPLFTIFLAGCRELFYHLPETSRNLDTLDPPPPPTRRLSSAQMRAITTALERGVGENAMQLEERMTLLASAVSGAPFLGLLGTVWGVMDTFADVAVSGTPNLTGMAPGVSGALVTTVTALLVAIPAMVGYNYLVGSIRAMIVEMDNFAAEFAADLEHTFAEYPTRATPSTDPVTAEPGTPASGPSPTPSGGAVEQQPYPGS
jgi:biopolymer transport protein ExbB/TolQ